MGWRARVAGLLVGLLVCGACITATAIARPTPLQRTKAAQTLVAKIPHSRFARGRRLAMMTYARRAVKLARGKHACAALVAADAFLNSIGTPTNWRKSHVPGKLVRKPLRLLSGA